MPFAHDTVVALRGSAALVNTAPTAATGRPGTDGSAPGGEDQDGLRSLTQLRDFVQEWQWSGTVRGDATELAEVRSLRPRLRRLLLPADDESCAELVNELLRDGQALPQVVEHDDFGWHIHATPSDAPLAVRMQVEAAMAMIDVLRAGERDRLGVCAADDCDGVVVDLSRNRSKRYCDGGCGNRLAAAAYRSRRVG